MTILERIADALARHNQRRRRSNIAKGAAEFIAQKRKEADADIAKANEFYDRPRIAEPRLHDIYEAVKCRFADGTGIVFITDRGHEAVVRLNPTAWAQLESIVGSTQRPAEAAE